jgi:nucleotide-binding universal stress UspA family protein
LLNDGEPRTRLDALHVVDDADGAPPQHLTSLGEYVATVRGTSSMHAGVEIEPVARGGGGTPASVAQGIMRYVVEHGAGLLVLGTRNQASTGSSPLGSVSSSVLRDAPVPVLLVPPAVSRRAVTERR